MAPHAATLACAPLRRGARAGRPARGLTLLELAIVLAVIAILGALAVPSMASRMRAERLQTAAEMFAADIIDARHEAARRGQALHIEGLPVATTDPALASTPKPNWCWSVATAPGCACGDPAAAPACRLKNVPAKEHPGVNLTQLNPVLVQADGQATPALAAVFVAGDRQLHVQVSRLGRARVCDPEGASRRVPRC